MHKPTRCETALCCLPWRHRAVGCHGVVCGGAEGHSVAALHSTEAECSHTPQGSRAHGVHRPRYRPPVRMAEPAQGCRIRRGPDPGLHRGTARQGRASRGTLGGRLVLRDRCTEEGQGAKFEPYWFSSLSRH